ncbi:MAG: helicase-related protein, partial [Crocinitomicaceae bacterium]
LIFCRTRRETQEVAEKLAKERYSAEPLHGDLSQAQRDRVMDRFRKKDLQLLVATDVAARGIDVDDISHVINYNLPDDIENYTHRSGRTARAGKKGFSFVLINPKEKFKIKAIEKQMRTSFAEGDIPTPEEVCQIQLNSLVNKVKETKVREEQMAGFMPGIYEMFADLSKEQVIQKFVSSEFNRFLEFYQNARDLNSSASATSGNERESSRGERMDDTNSQRYFVNLGKKDGLNAGGLLRVICDNTGLESRDIGKIDILDAFAFFETRPEVAEDLLNSIKGAEYEGKNFVVELTKEKRSGGRSSNSGDSFKSDGYKGSGGFKGGGGDRRSSSSYSEGGGGDRSSRSYGGGEKKSYGGDRGAKSYGGNSGGGEKKSYGGGGEKKSYGGDRGAKSYGGNSGGSGGFRGRGGSSSSRGKDNSVSKSY